MNFMRMPTRLLLIVAPVVFLVGLWLGLSKPGWSPRVGNRDLKPLKVLCPEGVFTPSLKEELKSREGLDLLVTAPSTPKEYFRRIYQNLDEFDVLCVSSHHLTSSHLKEKLAELPFSSEWRARRLHADFRSIPIDRSLERFWPLGWRVLLPTVEKGSLELWMSTRQRFKVFLEEDFREVLHLYLGKNLIREEWLQPDHTDPLTTVLSAPEPQWQNVSSEQMSALMINPASFPTELVKVAYPDHIQWENLSDSAKDQWSWGLENLAGNLQVLGLALPQTAKPEGIELLIRALTRPTLNALLARESRWASTSASADLEGPLSAGFLRTIPLTGFQMISGLEPSGLFWERIVSSSQGEPVTEEPE